MYKWIIENRELIKILYGLVIALVCLVIVLKTDRLFRLSSHQGIRYFRNAFFFYGLAFIIRYVFWIPIFLGYESLIFAHLIIISFEYFLIMAGFSLLYSLVWKKFEGAHKSVSSLFNVRIIIFYLLTLMIVLMDYLHGGYLFLFLSQIILFSYASIISGINYKREGKKHKFLKFYFIAMILSLLAWFMNSVAALYFDWSRGLLISVYGINIIIFFLFLYGVLKIIKKTKI